MIKAIKKKYLCIYDGAATAGMDASSPSQQCKPLDLCAPGSSRQDLMCICCCCSQESFRNTAFRTCPHFQVCNSLGASDGLGSFPSVDEGGGKILWPVDPSFALDPLQPSFHFHAGGQHRLLAGPHALLGEDKKTESRKPQIEVLTSSSG
eukprot:24351-Pelagomonas_calceolata.AAC.6